MAGATSDIVKITDDFYRDGFYRILFIFIALLIAVAFLVTISLYLYLAKPPPVRFLTDDEWRILPPVPLSEPYLKTPDLIQWISEVLPASFTFDFVNYASQLKNLSQFYTQDGWGKLNGLQTNYVNQKTIEDNKLFANARAAGAPFILNQGLIDKSYAWWIQMPITIDYITVGKRTSQDLILQALVVRVSTLNNLFGVSIENLVLAKAAEGESGTNE